MGPDVGGIDNPVIIHAQLIGFFQLPVYKIHGVWKGGHVAGGLKVVEEYVVINAMASQIPLWRQGMDSGVVIALASCAHFPIAVVRPDLNDVRMKGDKPGLI